VLVAILVQRQSGKVTPKSGVEGMRLRVRVHEGRNQDILRSAKVGVEGCSGDFTLTDVRGAHVIGHALQGGPDHGGDFLPLYVNPDGRQDDVVLDGFETDERSANDLREVRERMPGRIKRVVHCKCVKDLDDMRNMGCLADPGREVAFQNGVRSHRIDDGISLRERRQDPGLVLIPREAQPGMGLDGQFDIADDPRQSRIGLTVPAEEPVSNFGIDEPTQGDLQSRVVHALPVHPVKVVLQLRKPTVLPAGKQIGNAVERQVFDVDAEDGGEISIFALGPVAEMGNRQCVTSLDEGLNAARMGRRVKDVRQYLYKRCHKVNLRTEADKARNKISDPLGEPEPMRTEGRGMKRRFRRVETGFEVNQPRTTKKERSSLNQTRPANTSLVYQQGDSTCERSGSVRSHAMP